MTCNRDELLHDLRHAPMSSDGPPCPAPVRSVNSAQLEAIEAADWGSIHHGDGVVTFSKDPDGYAWRAHSFAGKDMHPKGSGQGVESLLEANRLGLEALHK